MSIVTKKDLLWIPIIVLPIFAFAVGFYGLPAESLVIQIENGIVASTPMAFASMLLYLYVSG